jgi:hypothetical protein
LNIIAFVASFYLASRRAPIKCKCVAVIALLVWVMFSVRTDHIDTCGHLQISGRLAFVAKTMTIMMALFTVGISTVIIGPIGIENRSRIKTCRVRIQIIISLTMKTFSLIAFEAIGIFY